MTSRRSPERGEFDRRVERARAAMKDGDAAAALEHYAEAFRLAPRVATAAEAADLVRWIGHVHRMQGDYEVAGELYDTALTVARINGLEAQAASARNDLGHVAQLEGDVAGAERLYREALSGAEICGDRRLAAMAVQNLGILANIRGELEQALGCYERALTFYRELEDDLALAWCFNNVGMAQVDRDQFAAAAAAFDQALEHATRVGDATTLATIHLNRGEMLVKAGDLTRARPACDRAFDLFSRLESRTGLAETYKLYSAIYRESGKPDLADAHLSVLVDVARSCQDVLLEAELERDRALLNLSEGRSRDALVALNRAHELFSSVRASRKVADLDQRMDRLEESYLLVVQTWGESIESKDGYTAGHCGRVADLACLLAEDLGFGGRDLRWIRMGAFLHDVGKTSVPPEVLNKEGPLSPDEWELVRRHPAVGDSIVAEVGFPWDIRPMVRGHHEHWDGSGYPDGLAGESIPLLARVLCVADIFDALTSERSYRPRLEIGRALDVMREEVGRTLDPELFRRFERLIRSGVADPLLADRAG